MFFIDYLVDQSRYLNLIGIVVILAVAWLASRKRNRISYRLVGSALIMHFVIGFFVLRTGVGRFLVGGVADGVAKLYTATDDGVQFVFGALGINQPPWGAIFAIKVLPVIIFFSAFMSLLFHFGIVQWIVGGLARLVRPFLGTSGAETLCAASHCFLGQTESPLLIKNYLAGMTKSEMLLVMVSGMGAISGAIMALYASFGVPMIHLLSASMMAIPSTILISKILYPEVDKPATAGDAKIEIEIPSKNFLDAISIGTSDGLKLALNIGAMLIVFIAFVASINGILGWCGVQLNGLFGWAGLTWQLPTLSLQGILGIFFTPFSWLMGLTGADAFIGGELMGIKVALNEMVAYTQLVAAHLPERSVALLTYALCGFANFSSIGIQLGGIGGLVPSQRHVLSEFGFLAVLGGTLSNLLSAMVAGLLI